MVVVSHLTGFHKISLDLAIECSFGWVAVSLFFFYSGYGLTNGIKNKGVHYLSGFWHKRGVKVVAPLFIAYLVFLIVDLSLHGIKEISFVEIAKKFFSDDPYLPYSWFVSWLLVIYLLFYIVGKFSCKSNFLRIFMVVFLVFYGVILSSRLGAWCKVSTPCFLLGVIYRSYENKIIKESPILLRCTLLLMLGIFMISYNWIRITALLNCQGSIVYSSIPLYFGSLAFVVWFVIFCSRVNEIREIKVYAVKSSYELYLCQGVVFVLVGCFIPDGFTFYAISLVGCIVLGLIFRGIMSYFMRKI